MNYVDKETEKEIIEWRRYLHQHPELSYEEFETAQFIKDKLNSFGNIELIDTGTTGVIGLLKGSQPGKTIALRADMDALPIQEESEVDFPSLVPGKMHACGHDTHMAMLLGAAKLLSKMQTEIKGSVKFIFQHAEEQAPAGAVELTRKGFVDDVDMIFGQHILIIPGLEAGEIVTKSGPFMAACDGINLTIKGIGSHSSTPQNARNPIDASVDIINALNKIVSAKISAFKNAVITICAMNSGNIDNVIPSEANILGTVRTTDPITRKLVESEIKRIISNLCDMYQVEYDLIYDFGYEPVVNDEEATEIVINAGEKIVGKVLEVDPVMSSEDFSGYQRKVPGCFFFLGAGTIDEGYGYMNHHPKFKINEDALKVGANMFIQIIKDTLT